MRRIWLLMPIAVLGLLCYSSAQTPKVDPQVKPATLVAPAKNASNKRLPETAEPIHFSAQRAADWLKRALTAEGRFVYGFQPALRVQLDGDNFASQAGAAFALARAARYFRDEGSAARARQSLVTLRDLETMTDPPNTPTATIRHVAAPPFAVNRLSSHGLMISAVHEFDAPAADLVAMADQLGNYLRQQQRPDGSLWVTVGTNLIKTSDDLDAHHAGWALHGIIRSHKTRPAEWKLDMLRKARTFYFAQWQANKNVATVCSHGPAYAEAFVQTKDPAFKDAVYAMNDWLVGLQYSDDGESARKHWAGGFPRVRDGKAEHAAPDIASAMPAESLAEACRVARCAGDLNRLRDYERALVRNLHFLMSLQYTSEKTKHFVDPFRPSVLGAFHASHQDGNIRIDYTQHALCAMVQYLDAVAE
ncbi:MAG: hypothetical protein HY289_01990 [Planctomycetes bacterium]|nr:hypothetical protein [Planctomycetota bacterium]